MGFAKVPVLPTSSCLLCPQVPTQALYDAFLHNLSENVKDHLISQELPSELSSLLDLAGRMDARLTQRRCARTASAPRSSAPSMQPPNPASSPSPRPVLEPMQVGHAQISSKKHQRRLQWPNRPLSPSLPIKSQAPPVNLGALERPVINYTPGTHPLFSAFIIILGKADATSALIDPGSNQNLISPTKIKELKLPTLDLDNPLAELLMEPPCLPAITRQTAPGHAECHFTFGSWTPVVDSAQLLLDSHCQPRSVSRTSFSHFCIADKSAAIFYQLPIHPVSFTKFTSFGNLCVFVFTCACVHLRVCGLRTTAHRQLAVCPTLCWVNHPNIGHRDRIISTFVLAHGTVGNFLVVNSNGLHVTASGCQIFFY